MCHQKLDDKYRMRVLNLRPANSLRQFQQVRRIRNECRTYMTRHTDKIGWLEQVIFYCKKKFGRFTAIYLGYNECDKAIAYALIAYDERLQPWVTGGLLRAYRGLGYGRLLFSSLCYSFHEPVYLEVLEENEPALSLYRSLGFQEISAEQRDMQTIITMRGNCIDGPA